MPILKNLEGTPKYKEIYETEVKRTVSFQKSLPMSTSALLIQVHDNCRMLLAL